MMKACGLKSLLALCVAAIMLPAAASDSSVAALVAYQGADRQARLIAGAKKEGELTLYTSIANPVTQKLKADFEEKTGLKMKVWRAGDRAVVQKVTAEHKTNMRGFDVVNIGSLEMEMLYREKILQPVRSSHASALIPGSVAPHNHWVATFVNLFVLAYNTDKVKKADVPKTYQDLLDPKWKGHIGIEATDQEWFYAVVKDMGEQKGLKYFRDLKAVNGWSVRNGHSLLNNLVAAGEVPLGLTAYGHMAETARKKGAPIDYVVLDPAVAVSFAMGISSKTASPHAAVLFYEYMLTDGQKVLAESNYAATRTTVDTPFKGIKYQTVDKARFLNEFDHWNQLWEEIIVRQH